MNPNRQTRARRPTQILSAVMLWLAAVLSLGAGTSQVQPPEIGHSGHAASGAARTGDQPSQRSTAPVLQSRVALLPERTFPALPADGPDGPETGILPAARLVLAGHPHALGGGSISRHIAPACASGFHARAPPILA